MMRVFALWLLLMSFAAVDAFGQPSASLEPVVTANIDPPRVVVGQKVTLVVTVLAPNYMPAPPVLPDFQVRNAVTRPLGVINQVETREGTSYAGVRYEFAIYPQEEGSFAIANQKITVTYAAEPPQSRSLTVDVPSLAFEAFIPEPAQNLDPFVSSNMLSFEQAVNRSSPELKVGDSITRTITTKADGTPAMLLPPATFARIDGLALYPDQPSVQDNVDRRTGALSATRIDEATYILERPGDYTLPPMELAWWNAHDSKIERTRIDAIAMHVADNPALRAGAGPEERAPERRWRDYIDVVRDNWLLVAFIVAMLALVSWFAPSALRTVREYNARRQTAYLASEAWSFAQLRTATRGGDPAKVYFALLDWLRRFEPISPDHDLGALKKAAQDPELDREIASLETHLYAPTAERDASWAARKLLRSVTAARHRLQASESVRERPKMLPGHVNPVVAQSQIDSRWRPVAR